LYRIQPTTLSVATHFPKGLTTLGVSWLRGHLHAVALHRGEIAGSWQSPEPVDSLERFGESLRAAIQTIGFQGNSVHLALSHPKLSHHLVDTPAARGAALKTLIQRQVDKLKVFDEPAAWTFEKAEPSKTSASALIHIFPRPLLYGIGGETEKAGLHLVSVVPPTSILHAQFPRLPLGNNDVGLLVADVAGTCTIVVARREGPLFLARSLETPRSKGLASLAVDLNRTLLFVSQQFGANVSGAWVFGPALTENLEELRPQLQVPVQPSPEPFVPHYWAQESLRVPAELTANLVSASYIRAPQRKALLRVTTVLTGAAVVAMLAATAWFQVRSASEHKQVALLRSQVARLQAEHQEHQRTYNDLARREAFLKAMTDDRPHPVPLWFLAYLGEITPANLAVTNLDLRRETNAWRVRISGQLQPTTPPTPTNIAQAVDQLAAHLRSGPFQAVILPPESPTTPAQPPPTPKNATSAFADWAAQLRAPTPPPPATPPSGEFTLQALIP
jgi:hypothetical protein